MKRLLITITLGLLVAAQPALTGSQVAGAAEAKYDFQLDDLASRSDVQMTELSDKPLVVHVWAPDCPMCKRNMPFVKNMFSKVDRQAVNFVACSMGSQPATRDYVDEHQLGFDVLYKGHSSDFISPSFTDDGWPTSFVFAPGGELIGTCDMQGMEYETKMLELIGEAVAKAPHAVVASPAEQAPEGEKPVEKSPEAEKPVKKVVHWWETPHPHPQAKPKAEPKAEPKADPGAAEGEKQPEAKPDPNPEPDQQD